MQYSSKTCDVKRMHNQYMYVYFKGGTTLDYSEVVTLYNLLCEDQYKLPVLYDISRISGMEYDAMDFSLKEWTDLIDIRVAVVYSKNTISEKYVKIILTNQEQRSTLRFCDNPLVAVEWLLAESDALSTTHNEY